MTKIKLTRSGGFMGKTLSAETDTDIDEKEIKEIIKSSVKIKDKKVRDDFNYIISINDGEGITIDPDKVKSGKLKSIIENELKKKLRG